MPIGPKRMPLFEHISELRKRLIIVVLVLVVGSAVTYTWAWQGFDLLMKPIIPLMHGQKFVFLGPFDAFTIRFKMSLYMAAVLGSPVIIWQILAFFLPALKPKERKYFYPTFGSIVLLFLAGAFFCWGAILNPGFGWMLGQGGGGITSIPKADQWLTTVILFLFGFGVAFELPVVIFYLIFFRIVPYATLRAQWRIVYVVLMVVASIATPDWSPFNMLALFAVLLFLYEGSMLLARIVLRRRIAAQAGLEAA